MAANDSEKLVGELVAERPAYAEVFEQLGIDYCCGGKVALGAACRQKGLDLERVLGQLALRDAEALSDGTEADWRQLPMGDLCDHIERTHHAYLRRELPRLEQLLDKVLARHGAAHPELRQAAQAFEMLQQELVPHMLKEERVLFPMIRQLEHASLLPAFHCGGVEHPIRVMESEHDVAGAALERMRQLTGGFTPPADACNSYTALLQGLARLEADLHQHIHKENNVLFARALELQQQLTCAN